MWTSAPANIALRPNYNVTTKINGLDFSTINSSPHPSGAMFDYSTTGLVFTVPNGPLLYNTMPGSIINSVTQYYSGLSSLELLGIVNKEFTSFENPAKILADTLSPSNGDAPTRPPNPIDGLTGTQTVALNTTAALSLADVQLAAVSACSSGSQTACESALRLLVAAIRGADLTAASPVFSTAVLGSFRKILASVRASSGLAGDIANTIATFDDVFAQMVPERNEAVSSSPA